jgi:hypothetical protein
VRVTICCEGIDAQYDDAGIYQRKLLRTSTADHEELLIIRSVW